jgi:acyl-CoA thioester hydrolase
LTDAGGKSAGPARITVQQQVQWADTDAAGHCHFTAPMRWVEQAESLLYERLEIAETTAGRVPRVHFEIDYLSRLYFRDTFQVNLSVERVGTTSLTYTFEISGRNALAARGRFVVVLTKPSDQNPCAWPEQARIALAEGGEQQAGPCVSRSRATSENVHGTASNTPRTRTDG